VSAGTLALGNGSTGGAALGTSAVTVNTNATFKVNLATGETLPNAMTNNGHVIADTATMGQQYTIAGNIGGNGDLNKTGAGTVALTGNNTYSSGTTISAGTLLANNSAGSATGGAAVTINSGATLGGSGNIDGAVILNDGGTIAPGANAAVGTKLSIGSLTWNGNGVLSFQLGAPIDSSPGTSDLLALAGDLTQGSGNQFTLNIVDADLGNVSGNYTLMTFASTTFSLSDLTEFNLVLPTNLTGTLVLTATDLEIDNVVDNGMTDSSSPDAAMAANNAVLDTSTPNLTSGFSDSPSVLTPTPEPGSGLLLAFGGSVLLGWRRRRSGTDSRVKCRG
jgi:autotransporter-associated beta strand protein